MNKSFGEREKLIESIKEDPFGLVSLSDELKNDREIVLAAVNKNGSYLRYVSDELKNDREIVTVAERHKIRFRKATN
tara:strand:+ start:71 stop:301 length:231 start_codon:yes stop_codon:yes gene_type:complete